ncbi:MAG: hypothetical protein PSN34_08895 [Urechidicola sp.]|nr:hypothetical protein [Urechidicola sp.]
MKKISVLLLVLSCFLAVQTTKAEAIIKLNNGVVVYLIEESCNDFEGIQTNTTCDEGTLIMKGMGGIKKWVRDQYATHTSLFKIKKGHIKVIDGKRVLYYKNWLFGKKIILGNVKK